jgi:hypothetical protein
MHTLMAHNDYSIPECEKFHDSFHREIHKLALDRRNEQEKFAPQGRTGQQVE